MLEGGAGAGQASYVASQFGYLNDADPAAASKGREGRSVARNVMGATMDEDMFRNNLRAEAKQRSSNAASLADVAENSEMAGSESKAEEKENNNNDDEEEERLRKEKERRRKMKKKKEKKKKKREKEASLLGDLPSLSRNDDTAMNKQFLQLDLELPEKMKKMNISVSNGGNSSKGDGRFKKASDLTPSKYFNKETGVPSQYACAINGHLMKEPVRTPGGVVFEKDTILLWLKTRSQVCPISGEVLTEDMLEQDHDLGKEIMCWNIKKTGNNNVHADPVIGLGGGEVEHDIYDF